MVGGWGTEAEQEQEQAPEQEPEQGGGGERGDGRGAGARDRARRVSTGQVRVVSGATRGSLKRVRVPENRASESMGLPFASKNCMFLALDEPALQSLTSLGSSRARNMQFRMMQLRMNASNCLLWATTMQKRMTKFFGLIHNAVFAFSSRCLLVVAGMPANARCL